jgi:hypothetical protein
MFTSKSVAAISVTPLPHEHQDLRFRRETLAGFLGFALPVAGFPAFLASFFAPLLLGDSSAGSMARTTDACAAGWKSFGSSAV